MEKVKDDFSDIIYKTYCDEYIQYVRKARAICDELQMPISQNVKWTIFREWHNYGRCIHYKDDHYVIKINTVYFKKDDERYRKYLLSTIIHELIHSIEGCMNHGENFLKYADIVNQKYGEGFITPINSSNILEENAKYIFRCNNCGQIVTYNRMCQDVKDAIENNGDNVHFCSLNGYKGPKEWGRLLVERIRK